MSKIKAPGKWIRGVTADMPATEAAERFLSTRLTGVCELLPLASRRYHKDTEYVHQLRIATRRSDAALVAFQRCIKKKRLKKMRKHLKRIRRAVGEARTCDVHASIFAQCLDKAGDAQRPILEYVLTRTLDERAATQAEVDAVADRYRGSRLRRRCRKLLDAIRSPMYPPTDGDSDEIAASPTTTLNDLAQAELPDLVTALMDAASGPLTEIETLHQIRIAGKRLRYAMEIFAPCFDASFRDELYASIKNMQSRLGRINDTGEVLVRLDRYASELGSTSKGKLSQGDRQFDPSSHDLRRGLDELMRVFRTQLDRDREAFLAWWAAFDPRSLQNALHNHADEPRSTATDEYDGARAHSTSRNGTGNATTKDVPKRTPDHEKEVHA